MLRTLPENQKSRWKDSLNEVVHAYNCTRNDVTGFSPFYLLFGRSPRLSVDLMFGLSPDEACVTHRGYAEKWQIAMKEAYSLAAKNNLQSTVAGKKQYDKKVRFSSLQPGDRVLVRNLPERGGPGKLRSYWEQQILVVVGQRGNLPVYEVRPEGKTGKPRVLHRNLLLPPLERFWSSRKVEGGLHHGRGEENRQQQEYYCESALSFIWEKMDCCTGIAEQMHSCCSPSVFIVLSLKNYTRKWDI